MNEFGLSNSGRFYTLVGSRETPDNHMRTLMKIAEVCQSLGFIARSGGARGADSVASSFESQIFLPWENFNGITNAIIATEIPNYQQARKIASTIHPAWKSCSPAAKKLHSRNVYQVLGLDLATPSRFLVCWAIPSGTSVSGGTRTAVELAKSHNVPVFNIYHKSDLSGLISYLR